MRSKPVILKLGGSVITRKGRELTPNIEVIRRLAKEVSRADLPHLIIVHGGGSFGHPLAERYGLKEGYRSPSQLIGFSKTHEAMLSLNRLIVEALLDEGIPAFSISPSSFILTRRGRILHLDEKALKKALAIGLVPVLYGDVILDTDMGFTILSGDQIVSELAVRFDAQLIVVGVDVDGIYTDDPKVNPSAKLIRQITPEELEALREGIKGSRAVDVTGGMLGKINELLTPAKNGIEIVIVNALKPDNIYKALRGVETVGTKILWG